MVSSAIALIAVTNYGIIRLLASSAPRENLFAAILPMALPDSVAVILVMSALYHSLEDLLGQVDVQQQDLVERTQHDTLTGVASRECFENRLAEALAQYQRTGLNFAVAMLDLDHFKRVNDLHGHQVGDELLKLVAARLRREVRESDMVARFGGDEFLILQTDVTGPAAINQLCERVCGALRAPCQLSGLHLELGASIGVVVSSERFEEPADYVRAADVALYEAKGAGRDGFHVFSSELDEKLRRRDDLEKDLRFALQSGQGLSVHYQPQVDATGSLIGVEALFRWVHPRFGDVPAAEAVEIAEELNVINMLGDYVFRQAAAFARTHPTLSVAINLSPAQFSSESLAARLVDLARDERIQPSQIEFEITERLFMTGRTGSDSQVQTLRDYGFRVALDDFGTGYSSLSYLRRFKVDRLKLDKSFAATDDAQENIALIRAAVSMAHLLQVEVIAEGIETELQETIALESGCDGLQGYRYGRPMTADQFDAHIATRLRSAA